MRASRQRFAAVAAIVALAAFAPALHAEVVEEIVAWVNGDVITMSEYQEEEQQVLTQMYQQLTGTELDAALKEVRTGLLMQIVDRKILVDQAEQLYDINTMGDVFLKGFKEEQGVSSDAEFEQLLEAEGMTIDDVKARLVDMLAPNEVIRFEVTSRVSVSDREIDAFYQNNADKFTQAADVTLSEIVLLARDPQSKQARQPEAEAVRQRVASGEDFAEVAREVSDAGTSDAGGKLGTLGKGDLAEHLSGPAFTLPVGAISEIIETPYGFHILKVDARDDEVVAALDDVRDNIRNFLHQYKYQEELEAYMEKARAQSDWCVKPKYKEMLSLPDVVTCDSL